MNMVIEGKIYKPIDKEYYISEDGSIYSMYKKGILKSSVDIDGYLRVDIHSKHKKIHRLVYEAWVGEIPKGLQVNHYDDNKLNNHYSNLYLGTQKRNIADCIRNQHRMGNYISYTLYDKRNKLIITFPSVQELLKFLNKKPANKSVNKYIHTKWFNEQYDIINREGVTTIESYISIKRAYIANRVENKAEMHEASKVG